jgi:hypothetical protein
VLVSVTKPKITPVPQGGGDNTENNTPEAGVGTEGMVGSEVGTEEYYYTKNQICIKEFRENFRDNSIHIICISDIN